MRTFLSSTAALALAACGGNVVVDGSPGTGGTGGTGGATATSSTTSTSSSTTSTSSSSSTSSTSSTSGTSSSSGSVTGCPDPFPGVEAPCSQEGQSCSVPLACCGGSVTCTNGFWTYRENPCGLPCGQPCGPDDFTCSAGTVCVALIGETTRYYCAEDPCAGAPLACSCAGQLCTSWAMACNNTQGGYKVLCD